MEKQGPLFAGGWEPFPTGSTGRFLAREATVDDAEALYELAAACSLGRWGTIDTSREEVRSSLELTVDDPGTARLVIVTADLLVASSVATPRGGGRFWISTNVHPEYQGRGLGTYLLHWAERRLADWEVEPASPIRARQQIPAGDEKAQSLLERNGYVAVRRSWRMLIEMKGAPAAPVWPSGIGVRPFVLGEDEHAVYEAAEEAFADHWDHVREDYDEYEAYFQSEDFDPSLTLLAVEGQEIAGVALCQSREERRPEQGEDTVAALGWIESLSVRQPYRRRGVALALLRHAFGEFHRRGVNNVALFVDAESETGAVQLYQAAGMRPVREWIEYEKLL